MPGGLAQDFFDCATSSVGLESIVLVTRGLTNAGNGPFVVRWPGALSTQNKGVEEGIILADDSSARYCPRRSSSS